MAAAADVKGANTRVEAFKVQTTMDAADIPDKSKICCMSFVDNSMFLGLATGDVCLFNVKQKDAKESFGPEVCSLLVKKKLGKKPVTQMEVVRDQQTVYVLCDGKVSAHDIASLAKKTDMIDCSNAHLFCVEEKPPYHICVSHKSKRQLFLYEFNRSMSRYQLLKELAVPDTVLSLSWRGHQLVVGYKREYSMLNVVTGEVTDVPVPLEGSNIIPAIQITSDREMLLASSGDLAVFVNFKGEPVQKNTIHWSKSPINKMQMCSHYVLGLLPTSVEVASLLESKIVQSFAFPKGISLVADEKKVVVASETKVMTLFLTSILDQVKQYLSAGHVDEALALLNKTQPSQKALYDFHAEAGFVCLQNIQFEASTKHFMNSNVDPRDVIAVFPDLQLKDKPHRPLHYAVPKKPIEVLIDEQKKNLIKSEDKNDRVLGGTPASDLLTQSRLHLSRFLWTRRSSPPPGLEILAEDIRTAVDTALLILYTDFAQLRWKASSKLVIPPPRTPSDVEHDAKLTLTMKSKERDVKNITRDTAMWATSLTSIVQSSLGAMSSGEHSTHFPFAWNDVLSPANACHIAQSETFLEMRRQFNALALLYQSKGASMRKKALDIWLRMGSGEYKESNVSSTLWIGKDGGSASTAGANTLSVPSSTGAAPSPTNAGTPASPIGIASFGGSADKEKEKELELDLSGIRQTVALLSSMNDDQLIYDFADWVLGANPKEGMKIFTSKVRAQPLNPDKVLEFLRRLKVKSGSSGRQSMDNDLVEQYLEHLLLPESNATREDPNYHNQLAKLYLKKVIMLQPSPFDQKQNAAAAANDSKKRGGAAVVPARVRPGEEPGLLGVVRRKLFDLLQTSKFYSVPQLLDQARDTTLYEEMIVLHAKSNAYVEVLRIYVFRLNDHSGAIQYCVRIASQARVAKQAKIAARAAAAAAELIAKAQQTAAANSSKSRLSISNSFSGSNINSDAKSGAPGGAPTGGGRSRHSIVGKESSTSSGGNGLASDNDDSDTDSLDSAASAGSAGSANTNSRSEGTSATAASAANRTRGVLTTGGGGTAANGTGGAGGVSTAGVPVKRRSRMDVFLELLDLYLSDEYKRAHPLSASEADPKYYYQQNSSDDDDGGDGDDDVDPGSDDDGNTNDRKRRTPAAASASAPDDGSDVSYRRRVVYILNTYSAWLDGVKALKLIPAEIPLHDIAPFLKATIPRRVHERRHVSIVKNLEKIANLKSKTQWIEARTQRFVMTKDRRCVVCSKPISDSIFSVHPLQRVDRLTAGSAPPPPMATIEDIEADEHDAATAAVVAATGDESSATAAADADAGVTFVPRPASAEESNYVITHYRCNARYRKLSREQRKRAGGGKLGFNSRPTVSGQPPPKARHQSTYG